MFYLKVTKFSDTLNLAILAFSFFAKFSHARPLKCMANQFSSIDKLIESFNLIYTNFVK